MRGKSSRLLPALAAAAALTGMAGVPAVAEPVEQAAPGTRVVSWGQRGDGGLGNGETETRSRPTFVCAPGTTNCEPEPLTGVRALAAGGAFTLALRADSTVVGWGLNHASQLGDVLNADRSTPVQVCAVGATDCAANPLRGVAALAAGQEHSLGLLTDGSLLSWGSNEHLQLGNFQHWRAATPMPVCALGATDCAASPLRGVAAVAAGLRHSLALLTDGTLVSWGDNEFGQLGDGSTTRRQTPVRVCAVGATDCAANPLTGVTAIAVSGGHNLARLSNGAVVAWGGNRDGQLGDNSTTDRHTPVPVCALGATDCAANPLTGISAIAAGGNVRGFPGISGTSLALRPDGTVLSWGRGGSGQLGNNDRTDQRTPVRVCAVGATDCAANPLRGVTAIAAGGSHSQALLRGGRVLSWGYNKEGQLGDYSGEDRLTPVTACASTRVADCAARPLSGVAQLAPGGLHSVVRLADGRVLTWGYESGRLLGDGVPGQARPGAVCQPGAADCAARPLGGITAISAGGGNDSFGATGYSLALRANGTVLAWGFGKHGQLGNGSWSARVTTPGPVCAVGATDCAANPLTGVKTVVAGGNHALALLTNGQVLAWGENWKGQLGDGTTDNRTRPVPVCAPGATDCAATPLTGVVAIAAGDRHSIAVLADGKVLTWGHNDYGQLGDGSTTDRNRPGPVCAVGATDCAANPLTGVSTVEGGGARTVVLLADGRVLAWGGWQKYLPEYVCAVGARDCAANPLTGVRSIAYGSYHGLALLADRTVVAWGTNQFGELGDGTTGYPESPTRVCAAGASLPCQPLTGVSAIAAGDQQSAAIVDGRALAWGRNSFGQVGDGTDVHRSTPAQVCAPAASDCARNPLTGVRAISPGYGHVLALRETR